MLKISKLLFSSFEQNDILYCHWKSNEHLGPGLDGFTDLDVLVHKSSRYNCYRVLKSLNLIKCKSQFGSRYPNVEDWIGFDDITGKQIHLHLHFQLVTGHTGMKEYDLPWTELALATRIRHEEFNVFCMEPNLEIVTLYTRIGLKLSFKDIIKKVFHKYKLGADIYKEIEWLKSRIVWTEVNKLVKDFYGDYCEKIIQIMKKEVITTNDVFDLRRICEKVYYPVSRYPKRMRLNEINNFCKVNYINQLRKRLSLTFITKKVPVNGGVTIAFLGQDGAGKTTVTNDIRKWISWKLDVRYSYLGSGENYKSFLKSLTHCIPPSFPFSYLKYIFIILSYKKLSKDVLSLIKKGEEYALNGGIQIFDRYPQPLYHGINDGPKIRYFLPRLNKLGVFFKKTAQQEEELLSQAYSHNPTIVFKLLLSPEESIRRKPENNICDIRQKHEIIKNLAFPNSHVYIIDASQPYDDEILQIKKIIWKHILK